MDGRRVDRITTALIGFVNTEIMAPGHAIGAGDVLEQAGVDSMGLLKVLLFVEREFGFWIPDEDLVPDNVATVAALAGYVVRRQAAE
jgi:acyl carrier protein